MTKRNIVVLFELNYSVLLNYSENKIPRTGRMIENLDQHSKFILKALQY